MILPSSHSPSRKEGSRNEGGGTRTVPGADPRGASSQDAACWFPVAGCRGQIAAVFLTWRPQGFRGEATGRYEHGEYEYQTNLKMPKPRLTYSLFHLQAIRGRAYSQMKENVFRGEVYFADLNPVTGHEQGGHRPVLVIQNDIGNRHSPTTIVAAMTTATKPTLPTHVFLADTDGISGSSLIMCEQIRTIDKSRLRNRIGRLSEPTMAEVDKAIRISVHIKGMGKDMDGSEQCDCCGVRTGFIYSVNKKTKGGGGNGKT